MRKDESVKQEVPETMMRNWFSVPRTLYVAVKIECARRRIPISHAILQGLELFLERSHRFRAFIEQEKRLHPRIAASRGTGYSTGKTRDEVAGEEGFVTDEDSQPRVAVVGGR